MALSAFPYVGGKSVLAPWIVDYLPDHTCYIEPFAGSASVLLNKPRSKLEVLNDVDGDVVQFFQVVRDRPDELAEFIRSTPYSRQQYQEWATEYYDGYRPDDPIERAGRWVYLRYASFGGKYGRKSGFKRASPRNRCPPSKTWANVPDRIQVIFERLRGVEIECLDALELIGKYDSEQTVAYCDPPYLEAQSDYYQEGGIEHPDLAAALDEMDGYAIVSYAEIPDAFSGGWIVRDRDYAQHARRGASAEWKENQTERLIMNFDPAEQPAFTGPEQTTLTELQ